jgi:hypothetical protein
MNGTIWNTGSFRDQAKNSVVHDTIVEYRLDFFAVLETGRDNFSAPFLKNLCGGRDFLWYCLPLQGRSRGILAGFNSQTLKSKKCCGRGSVCQVLSSNQIR